jgi:hypothetical protein
VTTCASSGRLQCLLQADAILHAFANVCQDLQSGLGSLDAGALRCDAITVQQVKVTLEQLGAVQAHGSEDMQRTLAQMYKLSETLRAETKHVQAQAKSSEGRKGQQTAAVSAGPDSPKHQLSALATSVLNGCATVRLVSDASIACSKRSAMRSRLWQPAQAVSV